MEQVANGKNGKTFKALCWSMGIVLLLFSTVFGLLNWTNARMDKGDDDAAALIQGQDVKIETYSQDLSEVKGDVKAIKSDIEWIKKYLGGK